MENLSVFDFDKKSLKIDKPIRLIELFAGIGSQAKALQRIGANFEHYRICEFDKYAIKSYNAIHGTDFETSDITKITATDLGIVDTDKYCYIMTYSFPCQDLSLAGKGNGMAKGSGTRSGLLWEVERLLNECEELPQVLLMENVTQVHGKKNKEHFDEWCEFLESKGYNNSWKDLNAKNFGIPQNRNRTFMVSVLGDYTYEFPKEFPLELRLKDVLETKVDEKFYLSDAAVQGRLQSNFRQYNLEKSLINDKEIHPTVLARFEGAPTLLKEPKLIGGIGEKKSNGGTQWYQRDRIYNDSVATCVTTSSNPYYAIQENDIIDPFIVASRGRNPENPSDRTAGIPTEQRLEPNFSGCSNTLTTVQKDNYVAEPQIKVVGNYSPSGHDASRIVDTDGLAPTVKENHGTVTALVEPIVCEQRSDEGLRFFKGDYCGTLRTIDACGDKRVIEPQIIREQPLERDGWHRHAKEVISTQGLCRTLAAQSNNLVTKIKEPCSFRIRKLTPKECWRLMGFDDADFEKAAKQNSNSQLYKQAGNSIVVDVLYYIFREML